MPPMALIVVLLLVALPLLELAILIKVGSIIGVWATFAIIIGSAVLGVALVRHQGFGVARRALQSVRSGQHPVGPMMEGFLLMLAGACHLAPGLITDAVGLILLIPPVRQFVAALIAKRGFPTTIVRVRRFHRQGQSAAPAPTPDAPPGPTIEGEYERLDERSIKPQAKPPGPKPSS